MNFEKLTWYKKMQLLRVEKDLTQQELAKKCNTTQKNYWLWENGKTIPCDEKKKLICKALNIKTEKLFSDLLKV